MHSRDTRQVHRPTVVASEGAPAAPARELTRRVILKRLSVGAGAVIPEILDRDAVAPWRWAGVWGLTPPRSRSPAWPAVFAAFAPRWR
jgi:hypothetical protein